MRSLQFCFSHFAHFLMFFNYKIHKTWLALCITKSKSRDLGNTRLICSFCAYVHVYTYACIWDGQCIHECDTFVGKAENNLRYWSLGIGPWVLVLGYWFSGVGLKYWSLRIDPWVLILRYWSSGIGHWVSVLWCWSSGIGPCLIQNSFLVFCWICYAFVEFCLCLPSYHRTLGRITHMYYV